MRRCAWLKLRELASLDEQGCLARKCFLKILMEIMMAIAFIMSRYFVG